MSRRLVRNALRCNGCQDVIESKHGHDFVSCGCGALFVDGGLSYRRVGWTEGVTYDDLSEWEGDDE